MANNTVKTRIQLKNDTEAHWNLAKNFCPLKGELIIYSVDETHPFSRLKVGDGVTNVIDLPFIESTAISGYSFYESFSAFPAIGNQDTLYFNLSENMIYGWDDSEGYYEKYGLIKKNLNELIDWNSGTMTQLSVSNNSLVILNGDAPTLNLTNTDIIIGYDSIT